jgi:hypothetical protein
MTKRSFILLHGHSHTNAKVIREWLASGDAPKLTPVELRQMADEWKSKGFLTADDARAITLAPTEGT